MWWLLAVLVAAGGDDVDLIPKAVTATEAAAQNAKNGASFRGKWFAEDALGASSEPRDAPRRRSSPGGRTARASTLR